MYSRRVMNYLFQHFSWSSNWTGESCLDFAQQCWALNTLFVSCSYHGSHCWHWRVWSWQGSWVTWGSWSGVKWSPNTPWLGRWVCGVESTWSTWCNGLMTTGCPWQLLVFAITDRWWKIKTLVCFLSCCSPHSPDWVCSWDSVVGDQDAGVHLAKDDDHVLVLQLPHLGSLLHNHSCVVIKGMEQEEEYWRSRLELMS